MKQLFYYTTDEIESILRGKLGSMHAERVFLVHGKGSYVACGAADVMKDICAKLQVTEFTDFSVNPKDEEAQNGVQLLLRAKPDVIIAVGGGSVMDMAKLIRHYAAEQGVSVPLWAIPTTAGTGAEATHFAVVYKNGVKHSEGADDILPDVAILYPPFTYGNNAYLTACTGFDAVAQAIESFWAKGATEESREYSVKALGLLWNQLPQLVQNPTEELRNQVAEGAYWAGRAINISTTTAPHAFSYAFTSHYGYPHGHAVALTFPFFVKLNGTKDLYELLELSSIEIIPQMEAYIEALGLSLALDSLVDVHGALQEVNLQRLSNNPVDVKENVVLELEKYLHQKQK